MAKKNDKLNWEKIYYDEYLNGYSLRDLSKKHKLDKSTIKNRFLKLGLKLRNIKEVLYYSKKN